MAEWPDNDATHLTEDTSDSSVRNRWEKRYGKRHSRVYDIAAADKIAVVAVRKRDGTAWTAGDKTALLDRLENWGSPTHFDAVKVSFMAAAPPAVAVAGDQMQLLLFAEWESKE